MVRMQSMVCSVMTEIFSLIELISNNNLWLFDDRELCGHENCLVLKFRKFVDVKTLKKVVLHRVIVESSDRGQTTVAIYCDS